MKGALKFIAVTAICLLGFTFFACTPQNNANNSTNNNSSSNNQSGTDSHKEHTPSADWGQSMTEHWQVCSAGGEELTSSRAAHKDDDSDGLCDTCGYVYGLFYDKSSSSDTYSVEIKDNSDIVGALVIPEKFNRQKVTAVIDGVITDTDREITSITIPASVTSITKAGNSELFSNLRALEKIVVQDGNQTYVSHDGILYNKAETQIIKVPYAIKGAVAIPEGIKTISDEFSGCSNLESVVLPNSLLTIGEYAFSRCEKLKNIEIPNQVTSIAENAFEYCTGLKSITVSQANEVYKSYDGILYKGSKVFYVPLAITGEITVVGDTGNNSFTERTGITKVTIAGTVSKIGYRAFWKCSGITEVIIEDGCQIIDSLAFDGCSNLRNITIPVSVTEIGQSAFADGTLSIKDLIIHYQGNKAQWRAVKKTLAIPASATVSCIDGIVGQD